MAYIRCGSGGTKVMDLLWTNPNPTSVFSPQTVALDLSKYKYIAIYFDFYLSYHDYKFEVVPIGNSYRLNGWSDITESNKYTQNSGFMYRRSFSSDNNGVTFQNAYNDHDIIVNSLCVPLKIYGIIDFE